MGSNQWRSYWKCLPACLIPGTANRETRENTREIVKGSILPHVVSHAWPGPRSLWTFQSLIVILWGPCKLPINFGAQQIEPMSLPP